MSATATAIGAELFVYGECVCGWYCMCPEGAVWPTCPSCGRQVIAPPGPAPGEPNPRLEAAVVLRETTEAVAERDAIGAVDPPKFGGPRRFTVEDVRRWLIDRRIDPDHRVRLKWEGPRKVPVTRWRELAYRLRLKRCVHSGRRCGRWHDVDQDCGPRGL